MKGQVIIVEVGASSDPGITIATTSFQAEHDKVRNLEKMELWIETAARKGARLIVFPEQDLQGYITFAPPSAMPVDQFRYQYENAETIPGPATDELTALARKYTICIVIGMTERIMQYAGGTGALFNSMVLITTEGVVGVHRKVHLPGNEHHIYRRGSSFEVYDTPIGKVGMCICHDKSFPESGRELMIKGADIIVHSSAWPKSGPLRVYGAEEQDYSAYVCELMERHTAAANQLWFISSNNFGVDAKTGADFFGDSRIIHPSGLVIACSGQKEAMVIAHGLDIKGEIIRQRTEYYFSLNLPRDREPSAYSDLCKQFEDFAICSERRTIETNYDLPPESDASHNMHE